MVQREMIKKRVGVYSIDKIASAIQRITEAIVEMERFELSSKRGINSLSTCLSSPELSGKSKTEATYSNLIL